MSSGPVEKAGEDFLCPDCGVKPGETHLVGCDVERCPECGGQLWVCGCDYENLAHDFLPWEGEWPGLRECRQFNLWCDKGTLEPCARNDPNATEDLNRLPLVARWDADARKWVLKRDN